MIKLKAVGDICPGDKLILGAGICSLSKKYGIDFFLKHIKDELKNSDILIGNLEGILTSHIEKTKRLNLTFCGLPAFAEELRNAGFNVVNVANNHILEHGEQFFKETIGYLEQAGIKICGLRDETGEYHSKPVIIEQKSMKIGVLGYNWVGKDKFEDADKFIAQSRDSVVNYTWNRNRNEDRKRRSEVVHMNKNVMTDIDRLKTNVDYIILVTHWGYEFVHHPPLGVIVEGHVFIDAGVDLIIGIHPHVLQGYELFNNRWIFYSLGNFIFDMKSKPCRYSVILECDIETKSKTKCHLIPVKLGRKFQSKLAVKRDKSRINRIIEYSNQEITSGNMTELLDDDSVYQEFESQYNKNKFFTILYHFQALILNPAVLIVILNKVNNFMNLIFMRLKGEKIRW